MGLSAPHDGAQAKKRRFRGPGQRARAAAGTALRAERTMASAASSEPSDGELLKQCSFSKGEWAGEYPVDVGFGNIYPLFETPGNAGFDALTPRKILAVAYAAGEHEQMLVSGPESFLRRGSQRLRRDPSARPRPARQRRTPTALRSTQPTATRRGSR